MLKKLLVVAAMVVVPVVATQPVSADHNENHQRDKVTICHRTNAANNPYVQNSVNESSVDGQGNGDHYVEHQGPVATSLADAAAKKQAGIEWGDIIPPVPGFHNGLNWTAEGQTIYQNGCQFEGEEPSAVITWDVACVVGQIAEEVPVDELAGGEVAEASATQIIRVVIGNEGDAAGTVYVNGIQVDVGPGETEELYFPAGTQVQIYLANEQLVFDQTLTCETPVDPEDPSDEGEVLGEQNTAAGSVRVMPDTNNGLTAAAAVTVVTGLGVALATAGRSLLGKFNR